MSAIFVNLALMMALLLASAGGTLAAAASSLPDSPLYPVKLAVEQVQVNLLVDPEQIAVKHLDLAQNRFQEVLDLAKQGSPVQEDSGLRLQEHFNFALQFAVQLGEVQMAAILTRTQQMLQNQLQEMEQVRLQLQVQQQDNLGEALRILQQTQSRVQLGLEDPQAFRLQARNGFGEPGGNLDCPQGACLPTDAENHYRLRRGYIRQHLNKTRAGYLGPVLEDQSQSEDLFADQECATCVPVGDANRYGQDSSGEPGYGPGQMGGNPDPDCDDCIPSGDENKYGQQPDQPDDDQPGGNADKDCDDCIPSGDENKYGQQSDQPDVGQHDGNPDCAQDNCEPAGDQHQEGQPPDSEQDGGTGSSDQGNAGSGSDDGSGAGGNGSGGQGRP